MMTTLFQDGIHTIPDKKSKRAKRIERAAFGQKMGLIARLFGCWHENLSRPFGQGAASYRACVECGARKPFNPETLETYGAFYYPLLVKEEQV